MDKVDFIIKQPDNTIRAAHWEVALKNVAVSFCEAFPTLCSPESFVEAVTAVIEKGCAEVEIKTPS